MAFGIRRIFEKMGVDQKLRGFDIVRFEEPQRILEKRCRSENVRHELGMAPRLDGLHAGLRGCFGRRDARRCLGPQPQAPRWVMLHTLFLSQRCAWSAEGTALTALGCMHHVHS